MSTAIGEKRFEMREVPLKIEVPLKTYELLNALKRR